MEMALVLMLAVLGDKEAEEAIREFRQAVKSPDLAVRVAAVEQLGRIPHEKVMRVLASCLVTDDKFVRMTAAGGLGRFDIKKPQACLVLGSALNANAKEPEVQVAIFGALKALGEPAALAVASPYFDHKNVAVAEAAIGIAAVVRSKSSIDPLVRLMRKLVTAGEGYSDGSFEVPPDEQLRERARRLHAAVVKALQSITRERLSGVEEWESWWKLNGPAFVVKP